jgi:UDPglucose 6-dehydrogenase/UDP-N-acetyl-D-galactosamine dehydrogenase
MHHKLSDKTACIAGLGYVGLPLAFSRHLPTIGFDVDAGKIRELTQANDNPNIAFTDNPEDIRSADFIIIAVPGPCHQVERP